VKISHLSCPQQYTGDEDREPDDPAVAERLRRAAEPQAPRGSEADPGPDASQPPPAHGGTEGFSPNDSKNSKGGRKRKLDSQRRVAEEMGIPQQTVSQAERLRRAAQTPDRRGSTDGGGGPVMPKSEASPGPEGFSANATQNPRRGGAPPKPDAQHKVAREMRLMVDHRLSAPVSHYSARIAA
jgi:hypothetical protein